MDYLKILPIVIPGIALIFQAGIQSEKIEDLFKKSYAQEIEQKGIREILYDMNGKLHSIEQDIKYLLTGHQKPT